MVFIKKLWFLAKKTISEENTSHASDVCPGKAQELVFFPIVVSDYITVTADAQERAESRTQLALCFMKLWVKLLLSSARHAVT